GAKAAIKGGCTSIEHGAFLDDETLQMMADKGVYFDPNFLVLHNYLDNKPKFLGIGNYTEEGFAYMEKGLPLMSTVLQKAMKHHVKIVFGTDGVAGAHGRNYQRHFAGSGSFAFGRSDRRDCARDASRSCRGGRQPAGGHHGVAQG